MKGKKKKKIELKHGHRIVIANIDKLNRNSMQKGGKIFCAENFCASVSSDFLTIEFKI